MNIVEESLRLFRGFHWFKDYSVSESSDGNFFGIEAEFLWDTDGLRAAVEKNGCCHIWDIPSEVQKIK